MRYLALLLLAVSTTAPPHAVVPDTSRPWFFAQRELDLTGDGQTDTVTIRADGPSSDSLLITLSLLVHGTEPWRQQWGSDYMLIDPPDFPDGEVGRAAYIRKGLMVALKSVAVEPFDTTQYLMMADSVDSALVRHPPHSQISLAYGYETTLVLYWDPKARAFHLLWGCC